MPSKYTDPRLADWLGETESGGFTDPYAGATPLITEELRRKKQETLAARAEQARIAAVPYGTPVSQGGTAQGFTVTQVPLGKRDAKLDANGRATRVVHQVRGMPGEGAEGFSAAYSHTYDGGAMPTVTGAVGRQANPNQPGRGTGDPLAGLSDTELINQNAEDRVDEGAKTRTNALQGIIDRYENVGLDTSQSDQSRIAQQEAIRLNRQAFQKANSFDPAAAASRYSENALAASLAVARSSPGAAGREEALFNALSSMPAAQAEGQRQANEEGQAQQRNALQAAQQLGQQATATRSLDESRAETKASIGLDVAKGIADFTGTDLQLDQRDREFLGEVALAVARLNLDTSKMTQDEAIAMAQQEIQRQGLAQEYQMFKEGRKISDRDILGGIFSLGGAAIGGLATGKAAGR